MLWASLELPLSSTSNAIKRYHVLGDRVLSWFEHDELKQLHTSLDKNSKTAETTKRLYLGWFAYEMAALAEPQRKERRHALQQFNQAADHWSSITQTPQFESFQAQTKLKHALSLSRLRASIVSETIARSGVQHIPLEATRVYLAKLAGLAYENVSEQSDENGALNSGSLANELILSSLALESSGQGQRTLIPSVASPRSEIPVYNEYTGRVPYMSRAYDAELQAYSDAWRPEETYRIQLNSPFSRGHALQSNPENVAIIDADAHMYIGSIEEGIGMAEALSQPPEARTGAWLNRINNAVANINHELESSPSFNLFR
jgi:hypothetical protein